jgi:hypothetical protein
MKRMVQNGFLSVMTAIVTVPALAQTNPLAGAWRLIAADKILPDGKQVADYGADPQGIAIFTQGGNYVVEIFKSERIRFASGNRDKGTPEEYKDVVFSQSCHFGTYSIDNEKGTITFNINRATFPNSDQTVQVRPFTLKGDTLSWRVTPRPDGTVPISVFKRIQ